MQQRIESGRWMAWLCLVCVLLSLPALAQASDPSTAARGFFVAVNQKDYATAWKLLSPVTHQAYAKGVADSEKMPLAEARKLFDTNDVRLQRGFWEAFRSQSKADVYVKLAYKTKSVSGDKAVVGITVPSGKVVDMRMVRVAGHWTLGLAESTGH